MKLSEPIRKAVIDRARYEVPRLEAHIPAQSVDDVTVTVATDHLSTVYRLLVEQEDQIKQLEHKLQHFMDCTCDRDMRIQTLEQQLEERDKDTEDICQQ